MGKHLRRRAHITTVALPLLAVGLTLLALGEFDAPASAQYRSTVRINEIESGGGSPGGWVELVNTGTAAVDVSGWIVKDDDDSHSYKIGKNESIAPGAFLALNVEPSLDLGSSDAARLFRADGSTLVDSHTWTNQATTTLGRCADGKGAFTKTTASTKGAANACGGGGGDPTSRTTLPGGASVSVADDSNVFGENLSGLSFENADVLWAVQNSPSKLYRLVPKGANWRPDKAGGFGSGKTLRYANGKGEPDAEGVVFTPDGLFVATERDGDGSSLPKVLRFDASSKASSLKATAEWDLTSDLPDLPDNDGPEAISFIPDSFLTAQGFRDERTGAAYDPATYPGHGSGLVFVGVEDDGSVHAYALDQSGDDFTPVATITSGFPAVMDLEFEPATGHLWVACDDTCQGQTKTFDINAKGKFALTHTFNRPAGMPNLNNEGLAFAPETACTSGRKEAVWSDDGNDGGHALRAGTLNCIP
ncbi:lamin tail domain-containing protein [Wenjunlia tyrosinilytica]|uniref:LTD domain-containing protein n=1 Tax=Wenjunlia tyrosinilytica TaxID=1544741 RepID=A0A917ZJT4_9ACTN|nr:lamin tail domain-containing protein [Wenjunlia tyrosinilytica]GGO84753.1 hypothetical protein GCM10012280_16950 [Wenjunlia tyrosinilytica]